LRQNKSKYYFKSFNVNKNELLGIGDWGLGIGDWAQSPIPNPQSPIPNPQSQYLFYLSHLLIKLFNETKLKFKNIKKNKKLKVIII
jgi:hypothetical protein